MTSVSLVRDFCAQDVLDFLLFVLFGWKSSWLTVSGGKLGAGDDKSTMIIVNMSYQTFPWSVLVDFASVRLSRRGIVKMQT